MAPSGEVLDGAWLASARCPNPKRGLAFQLANGNLAPIGCGRVKCPVCGKLHALTALEMVRSTSDRMGNPDAALTLTTRDPDRPLGGVWAKDVEQVVRSLRRRWPDVEYLGFMEWTTGQHARDGRRRPHMHALLRGLPRGDAPAAEAITRRVWEGRTGAHRVEVAPLRSSEDGVAYLALHHLKPAQHAPEGWSGRRLRPSKGWWGAPAEQLRRWAQDEVRERAHRHRVRESRRAELAALIEQGCPDDLAADLVFGTEDDPTPRPAREPGATVVRLKRLQT